LRYDCSLLFRVQGIFLHFPWIPGNPKNMIGGQFPDFFSCGQTEQIISFVELAVTNGPSFVSRSSSLPVVEAINQIFLSYHGRDLK